MPLTRSRARAEAPAHAAWNSLSEDLQRQVIMHCSFDQLLALKAISWTMCRLVRSVLASEWSIAHTVATAEDTYQFKFSGTCPKLLQRYKPLWKRDPMQFMLGLEFWHQAAMAGQFLIAMASRFKEHQEADHTLYKRNITYTRRLQMIVCGLQRWRNVNAAGRVLYLWTSYRMHDSWEHRRGDMRTLERLLAALVLFWREESMQKAVALVDAWLYYRRESIPGTDLGNGNSRDVVITFLRRAIVSYASFSMGSSSVCISDTVRANRRAFMAAAHIWKFVDEDESALTDPRRRDWEATGNDDRWAVDAPRPEELGGDGETSDASALSASEASASESEEEAEDDDGAEEEEEEEPDDLDEEDEYDQQMLLQLASADEQASE